jgi:hypothetical protein
MTMRSTGTTLLIIAAIAVFLGATSVMASSANDRKRPKNMGSLTVKTTPAAYPVKINGQYVGMSGVHTAAEFYLSPGFHTLEVTGPNGTVYKKEVEIRRGAKNCICLNIIERSETRACPYNFTLSGPDRISDGDLVTFAAINSEVTPIPIRYAWRVSNGRITSGLGTSSITVDSRGLGGRTINAELDVNDDVYDNRCKQTISVPTFVVPEPIVVLPKSYSCDEFESRSNDDDKARFDNCVIQVQNLPDAQLYVIIRQGTDRTSLTRNSYDRLSKRALDYMVRTRGLDPRRIQIIRGPQSQRSLYQIWIVPPGAQLPPIN